MVESQEHDRLFKSCKLNTEALSSRFGTSRSWVREILAEFIGTFLFVCIGNCSVAQAVLSRGEVGSSLSIHLGYGFAAGVSQIVSGAASGGHVNPAITFAYAVIGRLQWGQVPVYMAGQYCGAFLAACATYAVYKDSLDHFDGGHRMVTGENATAGIFTTFPRAHVGITNLFYDQILGTYILTFAICALHDRRNMEIHRSLYALYMSIIVAAIGISLGYNHWYPINPARDLSPRIFLAIAGWGQEPFTNIFWLPVIAPHFGAIFGALSYVWFIEIHLPDQE